MSDDARVAFIEAAVGHGSLESAEAIRKAHPAVGASDIHTAAILGDHEAVRRFLARDAASAGSKAAPLGWDALTHLCFSRYLRLDRARGLAFVRAARALLDAGASANAGFHGGEHEPREWESVLYGAAGLARHPELTRLLIERGAHPNDGETVYHAPETHDNAVVEELVKSGRLSADSLATMLLRKADWHDRDGVRFLLAAGADPNRITRWGFAALHQAARRDNALEIFELMLDHGADPGLPARGHPRSPGSSGLSALAMAARRGRGDVLALLERRGRRLELPGSLRLLAACARNHEQTIRELAAAEPGLVAAIVAQGGQRLAEFAGVGNTDGVRHLLELGVAPDAPYHEEDGYFGIGAQSTALHVAAWRARHDTVSLLVERGAPVDARDGQGRTPLALAVRACVDSYWTHLRSPESVRTLLAAGASLAGVAYPSGYAEVDELLRPARS
jgi:ankyrin repeat protein